jgi:hypothetical protein
MKSSNLIVALLYIPDSESNWKLKPQNHLSLI